MTGKNAKILLVDDEPINLALMEGMLDQQYAVRGAGSGEECLQRMRQDPPELVLLDIRMPGMDGFEVCRRLKASPSWREIPVIFVTASNAEEDESLGLELGAVDFITKPIHPPILRARIQTHLTLYRQKARLLHDEALLKATLESTKDGILVVDTGGQVMLFNQRFVDLWQIPAEVLNTQDDSSLLGHVEAQLEDPESFRRRVAELQGTGAVDSEILSFTDGRYYARFSMPLVQEGRITGRVWSFTDITEEKALEQRLRELSITDGLTGLYNRRRFNEVLRIEWDRARRYGNDLCMLMFDIDHFKRVNDHYGHEKGDQVLCAIAALMQETFRGTDSCFRYGGEEFCVLLPQTQAAVMCQAAERLRKLVEENQLAGLRITISLGGASSARLRWDDDAGVLLRHADEALYQAKGSGRNRVFLYEALDSPPDAL